MFPGSRSRGARLEGVAEPDPDLVAVADQREAGLDRVVERYIALGYDAVGSRDITLAESYLAKAEAIRPGNPALSEYRMALDAAAATPSELAFAVFPFEYMSVCHYSVRDEVTDAADAKVSGQPRARLAYSYYTDDAGSDAIPATSKLWSSNVTHREPVLETVREAGRNLGVNGVFMAWYKCSHSQHVPADTYEVDVYLIDVDQDRIFHSRRRFLDVHRAVSDVFDEFFAAHGVSPG